MKKSNINIKKKYSDLKKVIVNKKKSYKYI